MSTFASPSVLTTDIRACARCGSDHLHIELRPLSNPPTDMSHWVQCPTTSQPVLVLVTMAAP